MRFFSPAGLRPRDQAKIIVKTGSLEKKSGLTIVEMGCSYGFVLYNLRKQASGGGRLACFEADPSFSEWVLPSTLCRASNDTGGLRTNVFKTSFNASYFEPNSVDVFTSSHVVEHLSNPCVWIDGLRRIMKPGGIIFTEVPNQARDPEKQITRGQFHLTYFNELSFSRMMEKSGFERLPVMSPFTTDPEIVRTVFRKRLE
jgi:ubiquinone/menaquinone biosynthesis C-methylase UbiE